VLGAAVLGRVAEDESTAALAPGVHDGTLGGRRQLLEHLSPEPLDILWCEPPEAAARKMNGAEEPAGLPVADGVLVHAQHSSGVANVQEFLGRHCPPDYSPDVVFVEYVDFVHLRLSANLRAGMRPPMRGGTARKADARS
jgi:hypothetical protein